MINIFFWYNFSANLPWLQRRGRYLIKLIPHYLIYIIYETVKPSHLEKLQIIKNVNNLMFQVILVMIEFWCCGLNHRFLHPFSVEGNRFLKHFAWSFEWGSGAWIKIYSKNEFFKNVNTINWKCLPNMLEYASHRKLNRYSGDIKPLRSLKKYERMFPWG